MEGASVIFMYKLNVLAGILVLQVANRPGEGQIHGGDCKAARPPSGCNHISAGKRALNTDHEDPGQCVSFPVYALTVPLLCTALFVDCCAAF